MTTKEKRENEREVLLECTYREGESYSKVLFSVAEAMLHTPRGDLSSYMEGLSEIVHGCAVDVLCLSERAEFLVEEES